MGGVGKLNIIVQVRILLVNPRNDEMDPLESKYLPRSPVQKCVVNLEVDVIVVEGVGSEEKRTGVFVERIRYKSHRARDSSNNNL